MTIASYKIVHRGDAWSVDHDGKVTGAYATKEAAFEAVAGVASNAIKEGHEIRIQVPGSEGTKAALGHP